MCPNDQDKTNIVISRHAAEKRKRAKELKRQMTPAESRLWVYLCDNRLDGLHFRRQQIIDGFITDFYCHAAGLVIEVDGDIHKNREEYDRIRDKIIAARNLRIIRFSNEQIESDLDTVLAIIREAALLSLPK